MSLIREDDGSYVLYHKNKAIEMQMEKNFDRWPNELRWSPKRTGKPYDYYKEIHKNTRAVIVGKGPGLDNVKASDFKSDDVVICCNDSVHKIVSLCLRNPLYSVQLDEGLRDTCRSNHAQHFISAWAKDWVPSAVVLRTPWNKKLLTAVEAVILAKHFGCASVKFLAFDAMHGVLGYAKCLGYTPGRNPERFLAHKEHILSALGTLPYE